MSAIEGFGAIQPAELTVDRLQRHCLAALKQAAAVLPRLDTAEARETIEAWVPFEDLPSSLRLHSHNVVVPNQMVLLSAGERMPEDEAGVLNVSPEADYVTAITEAVGAVHQLQLRTEGRPAYLQYPARPDVILLAPAMHRQVGEMFGRDAPSQIVKAMRTLDRQRGYTFKLSADEQDLPGIAAVLSLRGAELKLQSAVVGMRAASTLAATIRLPPRIGRTGGVVNQLGRHMRHHDANLPDVKTARVFRAVQDALLDSLPPEHLTLLKGAKSGVKIVADAPLEWLPIGDLPLGLHTDVSRIDTTPGNMLVQQLRSVPPLPVHPAAFKRYLVTSMFDDGDRLAPHLRQALGALPEAAGRDVQGIHAAPRTVEQFIDAVNGYRGPILIVDSHGQHPEGSDVGGLIIDGKPIDVWNLEGKIRPPPIVVLSACDTHPFDRSHATVANGFLHCGAIAVLGTVLPIRSIDAARFIVRLLLRAISYGDAMNGMGRTASWTNIVGGALRMQLASDIVHGLVDRNLLPKERQREIQLAANHNLNPHRADWFARLAQACQDAGGFDQTRWKAVSADIIAASDVIRYANIGNPEAILLTDERVENRLRDLVGDAA